MYDAVIYFAGPKTVWSGVINDDEVIASRSCPILCGARWWAKGIYKNLDRHRCGYAITCDGAPVEHVEPLE